jgi:nucleotide-binding universal stress UspA family protein
MTAKPIVAGTDGSEESLRAVEWAAREAVLRGAPLRIVFVSEVLPKMIARTGVPDIDTVIYAARMNRDHVLAGAAKRAVETAPDLVVDTDGLSGPVAHTVTDSGSGASMLVVGSRGLGAFAAMVLGSVSRYAATHASCPVVVVRDEAPVPYRQVGVGVGDLDDCAAAVGFAFEEAALRRASLVVMHAWHAPRSDVEPAVELGMMPGSYAAEAEAARQLEYLLADWRVKYPGVKVTQDVVHGHPGQALAGLSADTDLLVLGRHASHGPGLRGLGAVTHAVLNHAHGPVTTVPSP